MMPITPKIPTHPAVFDSLVMADDNISLMKEWQAWECDLAPGCREYRYIAIDRLKHCLRWQEKELNLSYLELTTLPSRFPNFLEKLYLNNNYLTCLPEMLPDSLETLSVSDNLLTQLPALLLFLLKGLEISRNRLTSLPDDLPDSLLLLCASGNLLTRLPDRLPASLQTLNIDSNNITCLPETLPDSLKVFDCKDNLLVTLPARLPGSLECLYVSYNQLTHLPQSLPEILQIMDISNNYLSCLPGQLPALLRVLEAENNGLASLPERLPSLLKILQVDNNQLVTLPEDLPTSLEELYAANNQLTCLPTRLPSLLKKMDVRHNQLTAFPAALPNGIRLLDFSHNQITRWPSALPESLDTLHIDHNPLPNLSMDMHESMLPIFINMQLNFLRNLLCWHSGINIEKWSAIRSEGDASLFSDFLKNLYQGKNRDNLQLKKQVAGWLDYLAQDAHQKLRQQTFALAKDAAESCVDRASFYFTQMHIAKIEHELIHTDVLISQIVETILGLFRLQVLEKIAANKVAERRRLLPSFTEDLEIYLAYQYELRQVLALPVYTELQFAELAGISDEDIECAQLIVADKEKTDFLRYWFTESALWTAMLEKWDARKKAAMEESYLEAISAVSFKCAVTKALTEKQLPLDDMDAERTISCALAEALFYQYRETLTRQCLASAEALSLLDRFSSYHVAPAGSL